MPANKQNKSMIEQKILFDTIKTLLVKANTVLDKSVFECFSMKEMDDNKMSFILQNAYLASRNNRPLCQDTGQVLVFLKLPYSFSFIYNFKKVINDAVKETYEQEFYRKSVVKDAIFDRTNTGSNTPAIIYTDFEDRESVKIDILIKGGGAENMSFIEMFNPTSSQEEIIEKLSQKINERAKNACPPLFIGIGAGGTMDYAAMLSKKALFEGAKNDFCEKLKNLCKDVLSVKMISTSTHIASLPVAVTVNCHSNRHSSCEIGKNGVIFNDIKYNLTPVNIDLSDYKKINTNNIEEIKNLKEGEKILLSGTIYTMRDAAHKKIFELLKDGQKLPFEIKNSVIFYAGPAPKKEGEVIGPIGPTTAKRMDKFAPKLYDLGCIATIGKGNRSEEVKEACKRNNAYYFSAYGGIACYLQKSFKNAELIAFEELGTEAIRRFEIEDLPLTVEI